MDISQKYGHLPELKEARKKILLELVGGHSPANTFDFRSVILTLDF